MRLAWTWGVMIGSGCAPSVSEPQPDEPLSLEARAEVQARRIADRVDQELDCDGEEVPFLCRLAGLGAGNRPSWPSGARRLLPGISFGVRPSRTLHRGMLETADLSVGVMGSGGVAVVGVQTDDPVARETLKNLRRDFIHVILPPGVRFDDSTPRPAVEDIRLPDELAEQLQADAIPLEAVEPGERSWVGAAGVWYALPPQAAPARWVRIEPHGEAARLLLFLEPSP